MKCEICQSELRYTWTDTHGVAQCLTCGTPYRIIHYDAAERVVKRAPEIRVLAEYIPAVRQYWEEHHRMMPSGCSFEGGQELASHEDSAAFYKWMEGNAKAKPQGAK